MDYYDTFFSSCTNWHLEVLKKSIERAAIQDIVFDKPIKKDYLEKVKHVYQLLTKEFSTSFVVIAGGFATYIEGVTNSFSDVDFFIIQQVEDEPLYLTQLGISPYLKRVFHLDNFEKGTVVKTTFSRKYLEYQSPSFKVPVKYKHFVLNYNIITVQPIVYLNWINAVKYLYFSFDYPICKVALTPDCTSLLRFEPVSLTFTHYPDLCLFDPGCREGRIRDRALVRSKQRKQKYQDRFVHFGTPLSLLSLAWSAILINGPDGPSLELDWSNCPDLEDRLDYSDFTKYSSPF